MSPCNHKLLDDLRHSDESGRDGYDSGCSAHSLPLWPWQDRRLPDRPRITGTA